MNRLIHDYLNSKYNDVGLHECTPMFEEPTVLVMFTYTDEQGFQIDRTEFIQHIYLIGFMYETFNPLPTKP